MCTVVLLRRPGHHWPLILAANRDEMVERPWEPPARHWPDRPEVVAGLDLIGGGSWLGLNDDGLVAMVLNRVGSLGPQPGKRSRGELVLEALDHADAAEAVKQLVYLEPRAYRSFNLIVADSRDAFWLRHGGRDSSGRIEVFELPSGISMITAHDRNDLTSPRIFNHLASFETADPPDPEWDDWEAWTEILQRRGGVGSQEDNVQAAMSIARTDGFETVCSSLIALPAPDHVVDGEQAQPTWLFAAGQPDRTDYLPVEL